MYKFLLAAISILALSSAFTLATEESAPAAPITDEAYGGTDDVAFAEEAWKALDGYQEWRVQSDLVKGASPHGKLVRMYSSWIIIDKRMYSVIVKDNYSGRGMTEDKVKEDPGAWHKSTGVMIQRETGYDKEGMDWFYANFVDGKVAKNKKGALLAGRVGKGEKRGGCVSCHSQADGGDFLYSNDH